jgi:hypothetical protein
MKASNALLYGSGLAPSQAIDRLLGRGDFEQLFLALRRSPAERRLLNGFCSALAEQLLDELTDGWAERLDQLQIVPRLSRGLLIAYHPEARLHISPAAADQPRALIRLDLTSEPLSALCGTELTMATRALRGRWHSPLAEIEHCPDCARRAGEWEECTERPGEALAEPAAAIRASLESFVRRSTTRSSSYQGLLERSQARAEQLWISEIAGRAAAQGAALTARLLPNSEQPRALGFAQWSELLRALEADSSMGMTLRALHEHL